MKSVILAFAALTVVAAGEPPKEFDPSAFSIEIDGRAVQRDDRGVHIERRTLRTAEDVRVFTRITNHSDHQIALGAAKIAEMKWPEGANAGGSPAAIYGDATLTCQPHGAVVKRDYATTNVLELVTPKKDRALVVGFLASKVARPEVTAGYRPGADVVITATQRFLGRKLLPGKSIDLDPVYLATSSDPFAALDAYGNAVAAETRPRAMRPPLALWCSWYAQRMAIDEEGTLANAAVAAKYFKPLGFDVMQLDHGWQEGDITGDWRVDRKSFPHGLKWLAEQLQSRYGMKLGLWIAPTDVAETSELFKQHPDWMLKDASGKPQVNWRWYWKPNPNCYELDATNPAAKYVSDTFARLTSEGAAYYKIDFIAASGQERFFQSDPTATRGWSNLIAAMQQIRSGAGQDAWIRYCQTPFLASAGVADSVVGGDDTLDAGRFTGFHALRDNARSLASGYWINGRLYHREVCDMSLMMRAGVEEVRVRLAMMALAGCSISFSDELTQLPPSRLTMMQQCLPAGTGSSRMRPIDLFDREVPSIWQLHCKKDGDAWDVIGLFNFEETPQERTVNFSDLGIPSDQDQAVFEFWEQRYHGNRRDQFTMALAPHTSRILCIRRATGEPQVISTDMHLLQGMHELSDVKWDAAGKVLSGHARRAANMHGKVFVLVPEKWFPRFEFPIDERSAHLTHIAGPLWAKELDFGSSADVDWSIPFEPIEVAKKREY
jgi:alpha-galactosidase